MCTNPIEIPCYLSNKSISVSYTHLDVYKRQPMTSIPGSNQGQVGGGDWDWPEGSGSTDSGNAGGTGDSTDDGKLPPNTGDTSGVALGVAILALAGVGIGATAIHGKKKR